MIAKKVAQKLDWVRKNDYSKSRGFPLPSDPALAEKQHQQALAGLQQYLEDRERHTGHTYTIVDGPYYTGWWRAVVKNDLGNSLRLWNSGVGGADDWRKS